MKNIKLFYILALGLLLTLGACEKDSKSSGGDPSTPEGKIEMSVAALGTDGEKLINKLEKNSWEYSSSGYGYDEFYIYTKKNEMCEILLDDDEVYAVAWLDYYDSFSDAIDAFCDYHDAAVNKAKDDYSGQYDGYSTKEFSEPSEFIKYIKSLKEKDMKNAMAWEQFMNFKKEYGISIAIGYDKYMNSWVVEASPSIGYGG